MGNIVFLGVEGSGKTTLAMALAKAFARHADEGWYLRPEGRGAYNFATIAPNDFATDGFPAQTSAAREMTWTIARDGVDVGGMRILDYPGEIYRLAFLNAEDEADPDAFRARAEANAEELGVLNRAIEEAESLYVLFNLQDALNLRGDDANRSAVWVTNECLKRLKALPSKPRVTLVFTQVDRYQTEDDFLHSFTPAELDLIGHDHPDVDWMMVSVLVPPDSEFGIDAFVRRVTGLGAFGVPDGRPRQRVASDGGALARLAARRKAEEEGRACRDKSGETPLPPREGRAPARPSRFSFIWLVLIFVAVFGAAALAVVFLSGQRAFSWGKRGAAASQDAGGVADGTNAVSNISVAVSNDVNAVSNHAVAVSNEVASISTNAARSGVTPILPRERSRLSRPDDGAATSAAPPAVATNVISGVSARAALSNETAAALAAARACATPQEARETLFYAAEALGSADALYELARVDDFLGWGAFMRTREDKARNPPWTAWLRRIDLLGEKKAVFMQPAFTNDLVYRAEALKGYRAAAARGVPAAVDALARHATHENDKDVRRSGKEPSAPPVSLSPAAKAEGK